MRLPNHIALDFESTKSTNSPQYWALFFLELRAESPEFLHTLNVNKHYITRRLHNRAWAKSHKLLREQKNSTINFSTSHNAAVLKPDTRAAVLETYNKESGTLDPDTRSQLLRYSRSVPKDAYFYLKLEPYKYAQRNLRGVFIRQWFNSSYGGRTPLQSETLLALANVNFLRRERLYTKLKYSRTPAYDIVSGGSAALLAGFIGFLVSEKFGFELVDSGDFYFFFMYLVFIAFSIRPLLWVADPEQGFLNLFTPWRVLDFYVLLLNLLLWRAKR